MLSKYHWRPTTSHSSNILLYVNLETKIKPQDRMLTDDAVGGAGEDLSATFQIIETEGARIGLHVNGKKCDLITSDVSARQ
jgi:hypothetical protein